MKSPKRDKGPTTEMIWLMDWLSYDRPISPIPEPNIFVLNGALWDMEQVHPVICELGHFYNAM